MKQTELEFPIIFFCELYPKIPASLFPLSLCVSLYLAAKCMNNRSKRQKSLPPSRISLVIGAGQQLLWRHLARKTIPSTVFSRVTRDVSERDRGHECVGHNTYGHSPPFFLHISLYTPPPSYVSTGSDWTRVRSKFCM